MFYSQYGTQPYYNQIVSAGQMGNSQQIMQMQQASQALQFPRVRGYGRTRQGVDPLQADYSRDLPRSTLVQGAGTHQKDRFRNKRVCV